jgi:hypothetical protein
MIAIDDPNSKYDHTIYSKISEQSWRYYCNKHNIDFVLIDENLKGITENDKPIWNKEAVIALTDLSKYEKIGIVDCDTIIKWDSPNIFEQYDDEFCGVNDLADMSWLLNSIKNYSDVFFPQFDIDISKYINAGVIFFHNKHIPLFQEFFKFYLENKTILNKWNKGGGREQTLLNYHLQTSNIKIKLLRPEWNLFSIHRKNMFLNNWQKQDKTPHFLKYSYVWHFTGFPIEERQKIMQDLWENIKQNYD